jgi:ATPase subunit of ABC transporter with duplicated ATPase domains
MSAQNPVVLRFDNASFAYNDGKKVILQETDFSLRENTKITIMGQNGAGKSTLFKLIMGEEQLQSGKIVFSGDKSIAISKQVIPRDQLDLTMKEFFETAFAEKDYQIDKKIGEVLKEVSLDLPTDKKLRDLSGGQQARVLLAHALIQKPDILLLDEPTNNLDNAGIGNLIGFLMTYDKTVVVISHDADFLNMFTDGVLYLNVQDHKVEQYRGDYYDVVEQIAAQIEKQNMLNARLERQINDAKDKVNFFANKGGKMRKLASKMRDEIEESEENKVEVRKDDKTILPFTFVFENLIGPLISIRNVELLDKQYNRVKKPLDIVIKKGMRFQLEGPNGIGKTTLLKRLFNASDADAVIHE